MRYFILFILIGFGLSSNAYSGECEIWDVEADVLPCNEEGYFFVLLTFEYNHVGEEGFRVQGNGNNYGNFEYGNLPIEIGPLEGDGETVYEFVVIDNQNEGCSDWAAIDPVDCEGGGSGGGECDMGDLEIEVLPCNDDNMFYVLIEFEYENTSDFFFAYVNDDYFGSFEYEDQPIELGPFEGDGETIYNFFFIDAENHACHEWTAIDPVVCEGGGGGECEIGELQVDFNGCNDEGYYSVYLYFEYANTSEWFYFFLNDELYDEYEYEDLPILVEGLQGDGTTQYDFFVKDGLNHECNNWRWVGPESCEGWGGGGECAIWDVEADVQDCVGDYFSVVLDFEYENVGEWGFKVVGNGNHYGNYEYSALPVTIDSLLGDGVTEYEFVVKDKQIEGCSDWTAIDPVSCLSDNTSDWVSINPNPMPGSGIIQFQPALSGPKDIYIYDQTGTIVYKREGVKGTSIGISPPAGIYFYRIKVNGELLRGKMVVN